MGKKNAAAPAADPKTIDQLAAKLTGEVVDWALALLKPNGWNPNVVPPHKMAAIEAGFRRKGWLRSQALLVWRTDETGAERYVIIDGEHRWKAALNVGLSHGPVVFVDGWTEAEAKEWTVLLDQARGSWGDGLGPLLRQIADARAAIGAPDIEQLSADLGMKHREMLKLVKPLTRTGDDDAPALPKTPRSKLGEVYQLGPHRLVCGDSTVVDTWRLLLGDERLQMVWTDPPYGVNYAEKTRSDGPWRRDGKEVANDALTPHATRELITAAMAGLVQHSEPGTAVYVAAPAGPLLQMFQSVLLDLKLLNHCLVWVKDALVLGRSDYHYKHEPILYGWVPGAAHYFTPERDKSSVFEYARPRRSEEHPTMKPVGLVAEHVRNSSKPGWLVGDPFGGSGTTLIAAAQEGRVARLIEIDPAYCDVIRIRWTRFAEEHGLDAGAGALTA